MLPTPTTSALDFDLIYEPAEDTFLLLDLLEEDLPFLTARFAPLSASPSAPTPIVVELGTGSGIVTTFIHKHILPSSYHITTDLNPHACRASLTTWAANNGNEDGSGPTTPGLLDTVRGSLATPLRRGIVDVLVFNPPYVPDEIVPTAPDADDDRRWLDLALLGGDDGMEVTWELLNDLEDVLASKGVAYILFCKRNKPESVAKEMEKRGWKVKRVGERKAGWEVLSVWRFWLNE